MTRPAVYHCTGPGGRGCACAWHVWRRPLDSGYAAQKAARALMAEQMRSRTCPRRFGRYSTCSAVLEVGTIDGRLVVWCPACARFDRGICRDCPRPVSGTPRKARRCAVHKHAAHERAKAKFVRLHQTELNRRGKLRMRRNAAARREAA